MIESLRQYLAARSAADLARDALDVFIVYYVFYRALLVLRGTRAMQVGAGVGVVFVFYLVAKQTQLMTLLSLLDWLIANVILVLVVVFQSDIRRALQRVGSRAWFSGFARAQESKVIDEVVAAATDLARHRVGAIIAFEQDANLDEFVGAHKGLPIDAAVTRELLVSLFIPEEMNRLHDGAVVIRNFRIAKAAVFFPMPEARVVDESFGSRHRAALGITEETDAVVVVVSEERGSISFCFNGNIATNLDGPKLRAMLEAIFSPRVRKSRPKAQKRLSVAPPPERAELEAPASPRREAPVEDAVRTPRPETTARTESEPPPPLRVRTSEETGPLSVRRAGGALRAPLAPKVEPLRPPASGGDARRSTPDDEEPASHGGSKRGDA
jgi:uncharacterized protein (TIGR00159 family)